MELIRELAHWTAAWATTPYAGTALVIIAFAEASFFPIPPDLLLIPLALSNPSWALGYALICTFGSVLGGTFGYLIGLKGGRPLLFRLFSAEKIALVEDYFKKYDVWAIGLAALTPLPYKVFTIAAGVFSLDLRRFLLASAIGRASRFFLVALLIMLFGEAIKTFLSDYFELAVVVISALLIGGYLTMHSLGKRHIKKNQTTALIE